MSKINSQQNWGVIILAAGLGKRMRSSLPKVLHEIAGKPLIFHTLDKIYAALPQASVAVVVGHGREEVENYIRQEARFKTLIQNGSVEFIVQSEQKGTGHAARCAMDSKWGEARVKEQATVLVLPGDLPLISENLIRQMIEPLKKTEPLRLLTFDLADPTGYGRIIRKTKKRKTKKSESGARSQGAFRGKVRSSTFQLNSLQRGDVLRIVEEKDALPAEKRICEVNSAVYLFQAEYLKKALSKLSNRNAQNEYYLTDVIQQVTREKKKIADLVWGDPNELCGVNDPWELSQAHAYLNQKILRRWATSGVKILDPSSTWIDVTVQLEEGVTVYPGVLLSGATTVKKGSTLGPHVVLKNVQVGERTEIKVGTVAEDCVIGEDSHIGPYAHLRPGTVLASCVKIGNFVELKKSKIQENTSIAHLSYLGDAEVGKNVNIGCGFVTCNFDGRTVNGERKHRTVIEDDVFLGSDCQVVAPIRIGKGAYIASGSTITEDVAPGDLAIARSRQTNKTGYAQKLKKS